MPQLELYPAYGHRNEIVTLFTEYTEMLMKQDAVVRQYLILQNYQKELEHPESKYGMPEGRLYLAYWDGQLAGCIGLPAGQGPGRAEAAVRPAGLPGPPHGRDADPPHP